MGQIRQQIIRAGLEALHATGAHRLLRPLFGGAGMIFMLHSVRPAKAHAFQPNSHLEITPEFLRLVLRKVRAKGFDIVSLDEAHRRLVSGDTKQPFTCFTFDDGYRDNRDFALPVMREFDAPFTVYVASDFAEGRGRLWWLALEQIIATTATLNLSLDGRSTHFNHADAASKQTTFDTIAAHLRAQPDDAALKAIMVELCGHHSIDCHQMCRDLCLSWDELRDFARDPLVTIGAHTITHCMLSKASLGEAINEMALGRARIEAALGQPVVHFAYPYGDRTTAGPREFKLARDLGFKTAVTTRPGMIFPENTAAITALPRISLNGHFQDERMLDVLMSGAATALWNGFRRVNAA